MTLEREWINTLEARTPVSYTQEERTRLASSISRTRGASLLDADNNKVGETSISSAVQDDEAFYVTVQAEVLVLDLDDDNAASRAHHLHAVLLMGGFAPVMTSSGRGGHRHVVCRVPKRDRARVLRDADIPHAGRTTIRPPGALHRSGEGRSVLLVPTAPDDAAGRLGGTTVIRPLGTSGRWLFKQGVLNDGETVSDRTWSLALAAVNAGWTFEDFVTVLTCSSIPASQILADRVERRGWSVTLDWLRIQIWCRAVEHVASNPARRAGDVDPEVLALASQALTRGWPGRAGSTDFMVSMALLSKRFRSGQRQFDMSQREICEQAGISGRATVQSSLKRLQHRGLVVAQAWGDIDPRRKLRESWKWEIVNDDASEIVLDSAKLVDVLDALSHDVFRNRIAIGKRGGHIYAVLLVTGSATEKELCARTGMSVRVFRDAVRELMEFDLITKSGDVLRVGAGDMDTIARQLNADGRLDRQVCQFRRERDARDIMRPPSR